MRCKRGVIDSGVIKTIVWIVVFLLAGFAAFFIYKTLMRGAF